jgi:hypothetical protein
VVDDRYMSMGQLGGGGGGELTEPNGSIRRKSGPIANFIHSNPTRTDRISKLEFRDERSSTGVGVHGIYIMCPVYYVPEHRKLIAYEAFIDQKLKHFSSSMETR